MNVNLSSTTSSLSSSWGSSRTQRSQGPSQEEMAKMFAAMDSDGDGSVTQSEFESARPPEPPTQFDMSSMSTSQFAGMGGMGGAGGPPPGPPPGGGMGGPGGAGGQDPIQSLDSDEDGSVSGDEFGLDGASDEVKALFSAIDGDGDSTLSSDEISSVREQMQSQMQAQASAQDPGSERTEGGHHRHGPPPTGSSSSSGTGDDSSTASSASSGAGRPDAAEFIRMIAARYAQIGGSASSTSGSSSSSLSVSA